MSIPSEPLRIIDRLIPWPESEAVGTPNDVADTEKSRRKIKQERVNDSPDFFANRLYFADQSTNGSAKMGTDENKPEVSFSPLSVSTQQKLSDTTEIMEIFDNFKSDVSHLLSLDTDEITDASELLAKIRSIETGFQTSELSDHGENLLTLDNIRVTISELHIAHMNPGTALSAKSSDLLEEIDYSDSHNNKEWQENSAACAAADAKEFLEALPTPSAREFSLASFFLLQIL